MVDRIKKNSLLTLGSMILILASLAGLSGCNSGELPRETAANTESTLQSTPDGTNQESDKPENESTAKADDSSLEGYIGLLGLDKEKLAETLKETPGSVDEGGLEFKKAGIRVWFDPENGTSAHQIYTDREDIDLKGVKIGDKIDQFKETFGEPVSDRNGDMHFKYKDVFLSVNYDTSTGETFALYVLKEDF